MSMFLTQPHANFIKKKTIFFNSCLKIALVLLSLSRLLLSIFLTDGIADVKLLTKINHSSKAYF